MIIHLDNSEVENKILKVNEREYINSQIKLINETNIDEILPKIIDYACSCAYATGYCECMGENTEYKRGLHIGFELAKIVQNMDEKERYECFGKNVNISNLTVDEVEKVIYKEKRYI